jgi:glutamate synthase domain-containing protein 2
MASCKGKCETWLSSLVGRDLLYPREFGSTTSGSAATTALGVGYHSLRIQGYPYGSTGLPPGLSKDPDDCVFPNVDVSTSFGSDIETRCRVPIMTGALGSTKIAEDYWESFAIGAALCGFPIVVGENVVGIDRDAVLEKGHIVAAPELERRIEVYRRYYDGYGAIIVQTNVEDGRNGVAEYLADRYEDEVIVELKWGQGAKDIGGEIQVSDIEHARFLKERGYVVDPDPDDPAVEASYRSGSLRAFARHSRLGATDMDGPEEARDAFMSSIDGLRALGFRRVSLKTGAYGMLGLAMALRFGAEAGLDLVTIDGAGGGTGMSPWNMMDHWGVPSLQLHAKTYEYCKVLQGNGFDVPDISLAGGLAREDHIFKALALCAPYARLVCMGRAPMIPGFVGSNIETVLRPGRRPDLPDHWEGTLPSPVRNLGTTAEEIFAGWEPVKEKVGADEIENIPFGAIAMYGYADKLAAGLQQLLAGARKFDLGEISRSDLMAANWETANVTQIPQTTEAQNDQALELLKG